MSFDLFFCWDRPNRIDFGAVRSWSKDLSYFEARDKQLWYQNEDTGVYFSVDFAGEPPEGGEGPDIPNDCFDSGLSFNLNFNRPSYFGHEAMPIVENLSKRFGLFAYDPQARDSEHHLLRDVNSKDLLDSWLANNRNAVLTMIEHAGMATPPQMPLQKAMYRWNYSRKKTALQAQCEDGIFVPTLSPVRQAGSNDVQLAFVCTHGVPCLVPTSDWVFIVRDRKAHFWSGKQSEVGVISAAQFRDLVGGNLENFESAEVSLQLFPPKAVRATDELIKHCEFALPKEESRALHSMAL